MTEKEHIEKLYFEDKISLSKIAEILNISEHAIYKKIKEYEIPKRKSINSIDLKGQRFECWTVHSQSEEMTNVTNKYYWNCICVCGNSGIISGGSLRAGDSKSCGCRLHEYQWQGCGEIGKTHWSKIKHAAKARGREFNLSIEYMWNLFLKQDRKCAFTGFDLSFGKNALDFSGKTASLDRIDSTKGYVEGNVQWVHKDINYMKQDFSDEYFRQICSIIHNHTTKQ